jgi:hypothetical protein
MDEMLPQAQDDSVAFSIKRANHAGSCQSLQLCYGLSRSFGRMASRGSDKQEMAGRHHRLEPQRQSF